MNGKTRNYTDQLAAEIHGVVIESLSTPMRLGFHCAEGDHLVAGAFVSTNRLPPDQIANKMKRKGWRLGRRSCCPDCAKPKETVMPANDVTRPALAVVPPPPAASDAARAARREALSWLEEAFDPKAGRFKEGVNDTTIATETGLAVDAIVKLREEFYGPIKMPSEIEELRVMLAAERESVAGIMRDAEACVKAAGKRIDAIEGRIDALIRKNGW